MGFTMWVAKEFKRLLVFSGLLAALVVEGYRQGACLEQEWAFIFAVAAWWAIMLIGHLARRKNIFKPLPESAGGVSGARGGGATVAGSNCHA